MHKAADRDRMKRLDLPRQSDRRESEAAIGGQATQATAAVRSRDGRWGEAERLMGWKQGLKQCAEGNEALD